MSKQPTHDDHRSCARIRHVGECGALWSCDHGGERVYWKIGRGNDFDGPQTPEQVTELRSQYGRCV